MNSVYDSPSSDVTKTHETHNPPLLSARGRMGRLRYLAHASWTLLLIMSAAAMVAGLAGLDGESEDMLVAVAYLGALVIQIFFGIKRVHDINWPGVAAAIVLIPVLNLILIFWPGTKGPNKYGPPPGPNTGWIIAGAIIVPLFFVIGILATSVLPAYNDYTGRAQVGAAFAESSGAKTAIAEYYQANGEWPDEFALADLGLDQTQQGQFTMMSVQSDTGVIMIMMRDDASVVSEIAGGTIVFRPELGAQLVFGCSSPDIANKYLPLTCRGSDAGN